jgi:hypothetical protein
MSKRDSNSSRSLRTFEHSSTQKFFSDRSAYGDAGAVIGLGSFARGVGRVGLKKTVDRSSVPKYMHRQCVSMQTWCCSMNS